MWQILQLEQPDTFVLATEKSTTVRDFVKIAAQQVGVSLEFEGAGEQEIAKDTESGEIVLEVSPEFFRPAEVDLLLGDSAKARTAFGWSAGTTLEQLAAMMVSKEIDWIKHK